MSATLEIRTLPIRKLKPAPYNPRRPLKPGDSAWTKLERSLREFGLVEPLVWNETTGHIVGGHARLAILRQMGVAKVPVSVVRLNAAREMALNVVLNNREAQGQFDTSQLGDLLQQLADQPELDLTGFDAADLRAFDMKPVPTFAHAPEPAVIEVLLAVPRRRYEEVAPRLDELIRAFDLPCHIKGL